jgi:serine/threonine-protein kinase
MSDAALGAGQVVAGRYRLVELLGQGGMGAVWRADHVTLRSHVAVKLLHKSMLDGDSDDGLKRFLAEAQAAALLRSPHVVQILDHGVDEGTPYIAMELLDGESLASRLASVTTLSLSQTARLVTHVARAVQKAHDAGIVHRDLKPDNIFLVKNDDEEMAKVLDFGIAKMAHGLGEPAAKVSTKEGSLLGTPYYMSPEQVRGHAIDWRSDLWSLGVIAFECVCGRVPFQGTTVGDLLLSICTDPVPVPSTIRSVSTSFDAWFAKATARDVEARFQSAREMAEALRALAEDDGSKSTSGRFSSPPQGGPSEPRPISEARTVDAATLNARAKIEGAATMAPGATPRETIGGAASTAKPALAPRPAWRFAAVSAVVCALGLAAWLSLGQRAPKPAHDGDDPAPQPPASAPAPPRASAEPPATASAEPATPSSAAAPAASASAVPSARPHVPRPAASHKPAKDDLLF